MTIRTKLKLYAPKPAFTLYLTKKHCAAPSR